ncbi:DMT family transporter [Shewanella surugensis]|uniref:DMT family transporter n=1 Tax=Shewanella surugensis TaxID=212020 RepID=A0ABT0L7H5_9GAMM|nr:DMT family transporter [Shewanella surugensis]MCL1123626.1 DMT family transporter [Shewanella surugensis]
MSYLFPMVAVFIWSMNALVNKLSFGVIPAETIAFYRWFFAVLILSPFLIGPVWKQRVKIKAHLGKLAFLSLLGMVLYQSLAYFAAATTTATNIGLITSLVPLMSLFLAPMVLNKVLSKWALFGASISLTGLFIMLSQGNIHQFVEQGINQGDGLLLIAAFSYGLYNVMIKRWDMGLSVWVSIYMQGLFAIVWLLPGLLIAPSTAISMSALPLVAFAAIAASIIAPWAWIKGIGLLGAERTAMFMNLLPVITATAASQWLGEHLTVFHYVGGGLALLGVLLSQLSTFSALKERFFKLTSYKM